VRQLHLQLAKLPLAAGNLQGDGSLRGEVYDQFDLVLCKGLYAPRPIASNPISSSFLSIGTKRPVRTPALTTAPGGGG
jgi:hypothetical protein